MSVITAFSIVEQVAWQLWTLGVTKEVCSQRLFEEVPDTEFAKRWHTCCMLLLTSQLAVTYPAKTAQPAGGGTTSALEESAQLQQDGSTGKSPEER